MDRSVVIHSSVSECSCDARISASQGEKDYRRVHLRREMEMAQTATVLEVYWERAQAEGYDDSF